MTRSDGRIFRGRASFDSRTRWLVAALALGAAACKDVTRAPAPRPAPDATLSAALIVSHAVSASPSSVDTATVAYVSFPPGTIPDGTTATIVNRRTTVGTTTAVLDGGFDPRSVPAILGDTIDVSVQLKSGSVVFALSSVVASRPPRVVRTNPPKGQTDVPVLRNMLVVFSEPVAPLTVTANSLHLSAGASAVAGTVSVTSFRAEFRPDTLLAGTTQYTLAIEKSITNLAGQSLDSAVTVPFSTCPTYAIPTQCPPFSTAGSRLVTGVATELTVNGRRPLVGIPIFPWVSKPDGTGFAMQRAMTDSAGAFRIPGVPDGEVLLQLGNGMDMPCAGTGSTVGQDVTINLDGVSPAMPLPALATAPSLITGMVYESTPGLKKPVPGARVEFDAVIDRNTAWTTTDSAGRYALCGLKGAWRGDLFASAVGYRLTDVVVSIGTGLVMDLELKR